MKIMSLQFTMHILLFIISPYKNSQMNLYDTIGLHLFQYFTSSTKCLPILISFSARIIPKTNIKRTIKRWKIFPIFPLNLAPRFRDMKFIDKLIFPFQHKLPINEFSVKLTATATQRDSLNLISNTTYCDHSSYEYDAYCVGHIH